MKKNNYYNKVSAQGVESAQLAVKAQPQNTPSRRDGYVPKIIPKAVSRTRMDIGSWQSALRVADNVDTPRRAKLMNLYEDIMLDAHLTSQIELRLQHTLSTPGEFKQNGKVNDAITQMVSSSQWAADISRYALESIFYAHSLIELNVNADNLPEVSLIPRANVVPEKGLILLKEDDTLGVDYRNTREYGTWLLEFGSHSRREYGLLNKAVPHVLFMRFAQSCWSELCEIYGIPPRVMKTNTQDPEMLDRAEAMMRDMGSAAWFVIDDTEEFAFAKGADTNGDVYKNLMSVCKEALSVLVNGAVIGQDTVNGNRSKEETSLKLLDKIVQSDKRILQGYWNSTIIPALMRIGILPQGCTFEFQQEEDLEKLWKQTHEAMQYYEVDPAWTKNKFGIAITGKRETMVPQTLSGGFFA